jgi:HNH endonuclease
MVNPINDVTRDDVLDVLNYEPETGYFIWKPRLHDKRWTRRYAGKKAGVIESSGYRQIKVCGRYRMAHRLAWLVITGKWPSEWLDHRNRDRDDNRFDNLREATKSQNHANRKGYSNTGLKGASRRASTGKFTSNISKNGKCHWIGTFDTAEEAHAAYAAAAAKHHGAFARAA